MFISPELMLDRLYHTLKIAIKDGALMQADAASAPARARMRQAMEELAIVRILWDSRAIAITGLQGAGKTTFALHLLGNSPELAALLPVGIVTDEKIGILIREHEGKEVKTGAMVYQDRAEGGSVQEIEVPKSDFKELARNPPKEGYLLLTLRVPRFLFNDDDQGILLTPGIEAGSDEWIHAARRAVMASRQVVFVTNPTQLKHGRTPAIVQEIRREFTGCRMLPVLTHCDGPTSAGPDDLKVIQDLFDNADAASATIEFGIYPPKGPSWASLKRNGALSQLAQATGTSAAFRRRQAERLIALLDDNGPVCGALAHLAERADSALENVSPKERSINAIVRIFEEQKDLARRQFARLVDSSLAGARASTTRAAEERVEKRGGWSKFATWFCGFDLEDKHFVEDTVSGAWQATGIAAQVPNCLVNAGMSGLNSLGLGTGAGLRLPDVEIRRLLGYDADTAARLELPKASTAADSPQVPPATRSEHGQQISVAMKAMPHFAMVYMGSAAQLTANHAQALTGQTSAKFDAQFLADTTKVVASAGEAAKRTVATVVGTAVGADVLADGTATSIAGSLSAMGVTVTPAVAAMLGAGVAIAAAVVVAASIKRQLAAQDLKMASLAADLAFATEQAQRKAIMDNFDGEMDLLQNRIVSALRHVLGVDHDQSAAIRARMSVHSADVARREMLAAADMLLADSNLAL